MRVSLALFCSASSRSTRPARLCFSIYAYTVIACAPSCAVTAQQRPELVSSRPAPAAAAAPLAMGLAV